MVNEVMRFITESDPEVGKAIEAEAARQRRNLELIASENIVSEPVMMAMGTVLTNKYAEGYSGKRYYGGCECVDVVETLAIERAKKLFGCDYANVQPHSGAQANMAVFVAMLKPGDTVMGMNLDHGGHLTHGSPVNFSGLYFHIVLFCFSVTICNRISSSARMRPSYTRLVRMGFLHPFNGRKQSISGANSTKAASMFLTTCFTLPI